MPLDRGARLGPYEILERIGAGGMGEVYKARDTRLNRSVAIKISSAQFSERFEREARAIAALNHPHICALYDVGADYLVMELVEGPTLAERIAAGRIPVPEALAIARQIAEALEAAHEKGIVHRDLKPANVKVTPEGVVKVLDFGLAKSAEESTGAAAGATSSPTLTVSPTRVGTILGTAAYMSPEQVRGAAVDRRSDVWAFGVVLYEMLAGKRMFRGESVSDILAAVLRGEPDWSALPGDAPPRIRGLLRRCLQRDRKQRLQAIGEARIAIDAPEEDRARQSALLPWAAAAALAMALAVTVVLLYRATRPVAHPLVRMSAGVTPVPGGSRLDSDTMLAMLDLGNFLALSADGMRLAVSVRDADGKVRLAARRIDQNHFTSLSGTEDPGSRFFSPDGQWIAFVADGKLKKVSVQGGAPMTLCDAGVLASGSWGDRGDIVAALSPEAGLSRIPSGGGLPAPITHLNREQGETSHGWPQVLPGSQAVLFTAYTSGGPEDANIDVLSVKSGARKTLVRGGVLGRYLPSGHLVYLHRGTLLAVAFDLGKLAVMGDPQPVLDDVSTFNTWANHADFDFSQTGAFVYISGKPEPPRSIFWMNSAGETEPLHPAPGLYNCLRFSPDGKRLAFATDDPGHEEIWVRDLDRETTVRLTSLPGAKRLPVWTPDGKHIVFHAEQQPNAGFYWIRADGSGEPQRLAQVDFASFPSSFSPDGKRLAFQRGNPHTVSEIVTAPIEGDLDHPRLGKAEPLVRAPGFLPAAFSPDGHWLAYESSETLSAPLVYVQPFHGAGGQGRISIGAGRFPIWFQGANGTGQLFFLSPDQHIMVADYMSKRDSMAFGKPRVWSEKKILFSHGPFPPYDLAPDGKHFAVLLYPDATSEQQRDNHLTLLLNFTDELRRRLPAGDQ